MDKTKNVPISKCGNELKRGNAVEIFQDPVTELKLEGEAELISFHSADAHDPYETWIVRFSGENQYVERRIKIHNWNSVREDQELTDEQIRDCFRNIISGTRKSGDFLRVFSEALLRADGDNFQLLKPAAKDFITKYRLE